MSAHKYKVGQLVPWCVTSRNKLFYGKGVIAEQIHINGAIIGYRMSPAMDIIDPDNDKLMQRTLFQSEIDKGFKKYKRRAL